MNTLTEQDGQLFHQLWDHFLVCVGEEYGMEKLEHYSPQIHGLLFIVQYIDFSSKFDCIWTKTYFDWMNSGYHREINLNLRR